MTSIINRAKVAALVEKLFSDFLCFEDNKEIINFDYEVETDIDENGGIYPHALDKALDCFEECLKEQTNVDFFECEDFEKVNFITLHLHLENNVTSEQKSYILIQAERKSDTEFQLNFIEA